ncbi:MAG: helix-turn-helix transcriptional regulator [Candidatus Limnocylindrales bacterium]|nr:helix-turn-helix transcriptional regulator [Candidatus Limnocylindrales bacterium]
MTISRAHVARETARRMRRSDVETGEQIRRMRLDAGVTLTELARIVDVHRSHIARIESATARPSLEVLTAIGVALGADMSLRYFPGSGPRLHDRFQAAMIEAFLRELDPRWLVELEVPVIQPARGVIDVVLTDRHSSTTVAAEAQSELRRLEQQVRWSTEKADGLAQRVNPDGTGTTDRRVSRLLMLRSTVTTREVARRYGTTLAAAYPARTEAVVPALTGPLVPWPGAGIVWMQVEGAEASLMRFPPRGVNLGR